MGHFVSFTNIYADDSRLLKLLKLNPSEVFGRSYAGYLLFLAGAADQEILDWILQNLAVLDSLTGEDIGFAIFARRLPITLRVQTNRTGVVSPRKGSVGTVPLDEIRTYGISELCKSGRFGLIADGEELTAITYAVDDIARGFGVLGDLPCMIVLDGIPGEKFDVLPLESTATGKLIPLLRKAIAEFRRGRSFEAYLQSVAKIVRLQDAISLVDSQTDADRLKLEASTKELPVRVENEVNSITKVRDDLLSGKLNSFRRRLQNARLLDKGQAEFVIRLVYERHSVLGQHFRTIAALRNLIDTATWPLNAKTLERYETHRKYAAPLVTMPLSPIAAESAEQCLELLSLVVESHQKIVDEIMQELPTKDLLTQKAIEQRSIELEELAAQIAGYSASKEVLSRELIAAAKDHNKINHPTLSKVFARMAREEKLGTIKRAITNNASVFAGSVFKPDLLLKIWTAIGPA